MNDLTKHKIAIKLLLIFLKDCYSANVFRFAKKRQSTLIFESAVVLSQEIKESPTLSEKLFNISTVSGKLNQYVLLPNEILSFWKIAGNPNRDLKKSRSIVGGVAINEIGGGICQVSGIIYHLSLLAGLEVLERHNHSVDLYTDETRFTPLGTDATVVYANKDLRIKNNYPFAIRFDVQIIRNLLVAKLESVKPVVQRKLTYGYSSDKNKTIAVVKDEHNAVVSQSVYIRNSTQNKLAN